MEFLIRAALIVDSQSPYHFSKKDILVKNGVIEKIDDQLSFDGKIIESREMRVSPGWFDMRANFNDPGFEHKEDLSTGSSAAVAGGFTDVLLMPNTNPVVATKNAISYYLKWNRDSPAQLHPSAAVSVACEGEELTEMIDLHHAGAVAFSDGINPIWHTDILLKTLQYLQKFDGLLINRPEDRMLTAFGVMNEGLESTRLGMKGMPALSEEAMITRDLQLLEYAGGKIHFSLLSSAGAVDLVRKAKQKGLKVTADVGIHHLLFDEGYLSSFDANFKVNPPFRTKEDREALIKGLKDGVIDVVVSDHQPQDIENKKLEFDLAAFGITGLQTFYGAMLEVFGEQTDEYLPLITSKPRKILKMHTPIIKEGEKACLTFYSPELSWDYDRHSKKSKSEASPFYQKKIKGKVIGVFNNGQLILN